MAKIKSRATTVSVKAPPSPSTENWMYFKGNGHLTGRNGAYDRINVQRYFYIPALEAGIDTLKWIDGFSVVWQFIPVKQAAYYTTFFYSASQNTNFYDLLEKNGYVGCHPYPYSAFGQGDGDDFRLHKWEISVDGGDYVSDAVTYGQTYTQAFKCQVLNKQSGQSLLRFYHQIVGQDVSGQRKNDVTHQGAYAKSAPHPNKAMVFGNAPWWNDHQHERLSGYIRRIKIFSGELSDEDLIKEASSDLLVTTAGQNLIWWAKVNPATPDDLTSDYAAAGNVKRVGKWIDNARCEIVRGDQLANHHAFKNANTIGNLLHMERG
ncbi:MAG: hypothetical protein AB7N80_02720 [Bdellovibrionales bacterium]